MKLNAKTHAKALLLASVLAAASAFAGEPATTATVKFQDLNLDTPAGAEALYNRIRQAAVRLCSDPDPSLWQAAPACISKTEARAIANANLPALTDYYKTKTAGQTDVLIAKR